MSARLVSKNGSIEFYSPYNENLVDAIQLLPYQERSWDAPNKCWIVAMKHKQHLMDLCWLYFGRPPHLQGNFNIKKKIITELFRIEYIGALKDRDGDELSALGAIRKQEKSKVVNNYLNNVTNLWSSEFDWSVIFKESVLRKYFEGSPTTSVPMTTLYSVLIAKQDATQQEIKKAWRKMARRYHPDVNKDDDAQEMMIKINKSYGVLRNPMQRKRYDVGLKLEAEAKQQSHNNYNSLLQSQYWKPPIRCGNVLCIGSYEVGRFVVDEILQWIDIVENGRTLVSSWDRDTNQLVRNWI